METSYCKFIYGDYTFLPPPLYLPSTRGPPPQTSPPHSKERHYIMLLWIIYRRVAGVKIVKPPNGVGELGIKRQGVIEREDMVECVCGRSVILHCGGG